MGLYEKSNIIYNNELRELKKQIEENKREIVKLSESLAEYKRYLHVNPKTGLPNHKVFVKDLEKLIIKRNQNSKSPFAVLFIDLYESMTKIEYSLASCLSDAILSKICLEVKEVLENFYDRPIHPDEKHIIFSQAPLEGIEYSIYHSERNEELMIILRNIPDRKKCETIAGIIHNKITEPKQLEFNNDIIHLICHMAAALYPVDGTIKEELLSNTDIALQFVIKKNEKMAFYTKELGEKIREKKYLESELHTLLKGKSLELVNESIELYFQPFIDTDNRIIGAESLVRWQHPEKGMIMPGVFIHLAEKTGLIVPLGYKVLEKACKYLRDWQEKNLVPEDFFLSVNFSPKQFKQQDLVEKIDEIMNHYNIKSKYLRIEITEFAYFENPDIAAHTIEQLSHRGIKIMIDDCGAPGNAIYNLRSLPEELINKGAITTLKLDKTLIDAIERYKDRLLFKHNLEMAWRLNFNVIIEGIETNNQEQIIKEIEQELVHDKIKIKILRQGYLYSKPVPENKFIYLFKNQVPVPENNETLNELFT